MKRREIVDLHKKDKKELLKLLQQQEAEEIKLRVDMVSGKVKNTNILKNKKKDVARILTILSEKEAVKA